MRLTVGPHPAAVYWRRRAVVLVAVALAVLIVSYACGGPSSAEPASSTTPTPTTTLLHPTSATPKATTPAPTTTPPPTPFTLTTSSATIPVATGPCTDTEMTVAVKAGSTSPTRGLPVTFTITMRNNSARTCTRDVGASAQELKLLSTTDALVWSSDDCNPKTGTDVRTFKAGQEVSFTPKDWPGTRSRGGGGATTCPGQTVDTGSYKLIGRLGAITSAPVPITVRP